MRNNQDRLGIDPTEKEVQSQGDPVIAGNSDLAFPQPTEMVDLPTEGKFYPQGHPLHNVTSLEIRYMSAKDEEILTSKTLLQKGVALDKMIQGLLVDKSIKIDDLFVGDKNALVIAARVTGYGPEYKTNVTCPVCGTKSNHEFDLQSVKPKETASDIKLTSEGTFEITLPGTTAKVELKMLTGNDEKSLRMRSENKKKHNLPESPLTDQLKSIIVSLNGNSDRRYIEEFVDTKMLAKHSSFIREEHARIVPNLDLKQDFECADCGSFSSIGIPFTADFFWPNR